jgi:predicted exporter
VLSYKASKLRILITIEIIWVLSVFAILPILPKSGHPPIGFYVGLISLIGLIILVLIGLVLSFFLMKNKEDKNNLVTSLIGIQWLLAIGLIFLITMLK